MTKLPEMRERSVVRSSVMPSAKYSCSGSFDRFVKGKTTIDSRGAELLATAGGLCGFAGTWTDTGDEPAFGHAHQAASPMPITVTRVAAITARPGIMLRRAGLGCSCTLTSGVNATVTAFIAKARTDIL